MAKNLTLDSLNKNINKLDSTKRIEVSGFNLSIYNKTKESRFKKTKEELINTLISIGLLNVESDNNHLMAYFLVKHFSPTIDEMVDEEINKRISKVEDLQEQLKVRTLCHLQFIKNLIDADVLYQALLEIDKVELKRVREALEMAVKKANEAAPSVIEDIKKDFEAMKADAELS